jgi:hypothetical protein
MPYPETKQKILHNESLDFRLRIPHHGQYESSHRPEALTVPWTTAKFPSMLPSPAAFIRHEFDSTTVYMGFEEEDARSVAKPCTVKEWPFPSLKPRASTQEPVPIGP